MQFPKKRIYPVMPLNMCFSKEAFSVDGSPTPTTPVVVRPYRRFLDLLFKENHIQHLPGFDSKHSTSFNP